MDQIPLTLNAIQRLDGCAFPQKKAKKRRAALDSPHHQGASTCIHYGMGGEGRNPLFVPIIESSSLHHITGAEKSFFLKIWSMVAQDLGRDTSAAELFA